MSFIAQMQALSVETETKFVEETVTKESRTATIKDEKFKALTAKYHSSIKTGIEHAAKRGKREKYINFDRDDFKANCVGLGFPQEFQDMWLKEMCNPKSEYLPTNDDTGEKIHFEGISYNIWNNRNFTTVFKW